MLASGWQLDGEPNRHMEARLMTTDDGPQCGSWSRWPGNREYQVWAIC